MDYKQYFIDKDISFKELMTCIKQADIKKNPQLKDLYRVLPKTGRLQYNSYNMIPYQPMIKKIIDDLVNSDPQLKQDFNLFIEKIDLLEDIMNDQGNEISSIKEAELKKFYERVGNYILQNYKKTEYIEDKTNDNQKTDITRSTKKQKYHKRKYLNEKKAKSYIHSIANEQQNEIERNIEEYNRRMEEQLIV